MFSLLLIAACAGPQPAPPTPAAAPPPARGFTLLSINDTYRIEGDRHAQQGGMARVRTLRAQLEAQGQPVLMLHGGDFISPSFLSRDAALQGRQMVDALNHLDGDPTAHDPFMFVVPGNHEFDLAPTALAQRMAESQFSWLASNLEIQAEGLAAQPFGGPVVVELGDVKVGLFGLGMDKRGKDWVHQLEDSQGIAARETASLRQQGAEVVVALTHQSFAQDLALIDALDNGLGPDIIVGGHDHISGAELRGDGARLVIKGDSDARSAAVVHLQVGPAPAIDYRLVDLGPEVPEDPTIRAAVDGWLADHDARWCAAADQAPGCLEQPVGTAGTTLIGRETRLRRFETNLGNWVADTMRSTAQAAGHKVDIAFTNAGGMRLDADVPAGPISRRVAEELVAFHTPLVLVELTGAQLQAVLDRAVSDWRGQGRFMQVAGMAFVHDPARTPDRVLGLSLVQADGRLRPVRPDEVLTAVTSTYVATGGDGYGMLAQNRQTPLPFELGALVLSELRRAGDAGISPVEDGRICTVGHSAVCLAPIPPPM